MKLDTENDNVNIVTMSVSRVREIETGIDEFDTALDEAQAPVFGDETKVFYLVIEIIPDKV